MAVSPPKIISRLSSQIDRLSASYETLMNEADGLRVRLQDMEYENRKLTEELRQARQEADYLKISHRLADDPDGLVEARRWIDRMIRDIDRCISLLKE